MARMKVISVEVETADHANVGDMIRAALGLPAAEGGGGASAPAVVIDTPAAALPETSRPLELLPERSAPAPKTKRGRKALPAPKPAAPSATAAAKPGSGMQERILGLLEKRPMSSMELIHTLGVESQSVYGACSLMKSKGILESKNDDQGDGTRRWYVRK